MQIQRVHESPVVRRRVAEEVENNVPMEIAGHGTMGVISVKM